MTAGNLEACLQSEGAVIVPVSGTSMQPLLTEGRSSVLLAAYRGEPLKKGDIVLYRRRDGSLILHRIWEITRENRYLLWGDHRWTLDEPVSGDQILAVVQEVFQDGRPMDPASRRYRLYQKLWNKNRILRRICLAGLRMIGPESHTSKQ